MFLWWVRFLNPNSLDNKGRWRILKDFYCSVTMLRVNGTGSTVHYIETYHTFIGIFMKGGKSYIWLKLAHKQNWYSKELNPCCYSNTLYISDNKTHSQGPWTKIKVQGPCPSRSLQLEPNPWTSPAHQTSTSRLLVSSLSSHMPYYPSYCLA